jgi:hypothetical protein
MFTDGGRLDKIVCGNPTCPHCGATYPITERHNCIFSQDAKLKVEKERADKAEKELQAAKVMLRDQFAMAALQGLIAHHGDSGNGDSIQSIEGAAQTVYEYADAMMDARKAR